MQAQSHAVAVGVLPVDVVRSLRLSSLHAAAAVCVSPHLDSDDPKGQFSRHDGHKVTRQAVSDRSQRVKEGMVLIKLCQLKMISRPNPLTLSLVQS